jgi:HEAT repeat protein
MLLGQLLLAEEIGAVRGALEDQDGGARLAALRAFSAFGESEPELAPEVVQSLLKVARTPCEPLERRAAIEGLARLKRLETLGALLALADEREEEVQVAAITALGELEAEEADAALRQLVASADEVRRKAAAKALYRQTRPVRTPSAAERARERRLRGDARPFVLISLNAALRALEDAGPYEEAALTGCIARVCIDFAATRRYLVEKGLMTREAGIYRLTALGEAVWRVERALAAHAGRERAAR